MGRCSSSMTTRSRLGGDGGVHGLSHGDDLVRELCDLVDEAYVSLPSASRQCFSASNHFHPLGVSRSSELLRSTSLPALSGVSPSTTTSIPLVDSRRVPCMKTNSQRHALDERVVKGSKLASCTRLAHAEAAVVGDAISQRAARPRVKFDRPALFIDVIGCMYRGIWLSGCI